MITRFLNKHDIQTDVFMLGLARMIDSFSSSLLIILIPLIVKERSIHFGSYATAAVSGILLSAYGLTNFVIQPSAGTWMDRSGKYKPFIIWGLSLYAGATACFIWFHSFFSLLSLRIVQGVGIAFTIPPTLSLITRYSTKSNRGTAMGFYNMMRMVGFCIGPVVAGTLADRLGHVYVLALGAITAWVGCLLVSLLVTEPENVTPSNDDHSLREAVMYFFQPDRLPFLKIAAANLAMALSISLISALENEFNEKLHQGAMEFGFAFSALILSLVIFQLPMGMLADRVGRKLPIVGGMMFLIPTTLLMPYVGTTWQLIVLRMLQGISVAAVSAPSFALGGDQSKEGSRGREMSLISMAFVLGIGIGPAFGGILAGQFFFSAPFWFGAALCLCTAILVSTSVKETLPAQ